MVDVDVRHQKIPVNNGKKLPSQLVKPGFLPSTVSLISRYFGCALVRPTSPSPKSKAGAKARGHRNLNFVRDGAHAIRTSWGHFSTFPLSIFPLEGFSHPGKILVYSRTQHWVFVHVSFRELRFAGLDSPIPILPVWKPVDAAFFGQMRRICELGIEEFKVRKGPRLIEVCEVSMTLFFPFLQLLFFKYVSGLSRSNN